MLLYIFNFFVICSVAGLKTWIPNTNIDNANNLEWDLREVEEDCHKAIFNVRNDLSIFWTLPHVTLTELILPYFGVILFPGETSIVFIDKNECSERATTKYIRDDFKHWLDPSNWKSDSNFSWTPHIEQIPCAGEDIMFPAGDSFGIQLPSILLPIGQIHFNNMVYDGEEWPRLLDSDTGHEFFKSSNEDLYRMSWKNDFGCIHRKECFCGRSAYTITDGFYKDMDYSLLEQTVCQNIKNKCETPQCLFPVVPDGHCCGICGAIIKLKDETEDGLDLNVIRRKVNKEIDDVDNNYEKMTYIGRTSDGNIQVVFVAKNPAETKYIISFADIIEKKLMGHNIQAAISLKYSGLPTSNYFFGGPLGVVIGTFLGAIAVFLAIYYFYIILPKKNFRLSALAQRKAFLFARFENVANDEDSDVNLEIAAEPGTSNEPNKAFDNPMYTGESLKNAQSDVVSDSNVTSSTESSVAVTREEFSNPVYGELEKSELNIFQDDNKVKENAETDDDTLNLFSEIEI